MTTKDAKSVTGKTNSRQNSATAIVQQPSNVKITVNADQYQWHIKSPEHISGMKTRITLRGGAKQNQNMAHTRAHAYNGMWKSPAKGSNVEIMS